MMLISIKTHPGVEDVGKGVRLQGRGRTALGGRGEASSFAGGMGNGWVDEFSTLKNASPTLSKKRKYTTHCFNFENLEL